MKSITIHNVEETNALANKLAKSIKCPSCICLKGDLGAGKTTFTKAFAKALGIDDVITSPTFQIMKLYETDDVKLCHIDAYRLEGMHQDLGFEEDIEDSISVIEWYEFIDDVLPMERLEINIQIDNDDRIFTFNAVGEYYVNLLEEL